jgi:hypothetical protein
MPRITPKTNWVANDIPIAQDINRIETNSLQAFTELDEEVVNRNAAILVETTNRQNADTTLQTNIDTANSLRLSGDNQLQTNINLEASARSGSDNNLQNSINTKFTAGGVGAYAFLRNDSGSTMVTGTTYSGGLSYADTDNNTGGFASGVWRCMGYALNGKGTLFIRVS